MWNGSLQQLREKVYRVTEGKMLMASLGAINVCIL